MVSHNVSPADEGQGAFHRPMATPLLRLIAALRAGNAVSDAALVANWSVATAQAVANSPLVKALVAR